MLEGTELGPMVLAGELGVASALKMAYAAWTKGSAALLHGSLDFAEQLRLCSRKREL